MAKAKDPSKQKSKFWTEESMKAAVMNCIRYESKGLRTKARLYNIPVDTLKRHASASIEAGMDAGQDQGLPSLLQRRRSWPVI